MTTLDDAVGRYRDAVTSLGLTWQDDESPDEVDVAFAARLFGVDSVPDDVVRLYTLVTQGMLLLPDLGYLLDWPASDESLNDLTWSIGVPFPWRQQMPVFRFERVLFTVVLAGPHAGEVWRYELDVDAEHGAVRAARDLAALFDQWADGIAAGMLRNEGGFVMLDDERLGPPLEASAARFSQCDPPLDMRAFPERIIGEPDLPAWQRECGVDPDAFGIPFEEIEALDRELAAVRRGFRD